MTEQQAPTLRAYAALLYAVTCASEAASPDASPETKQESGRAYEAAEEAIRALAQPIDTASPSPASLPILPAPGSKKQSELIDIELAKRAWPANNRNAGRAGWEACLAAIALATPRPSPTGPREGEPPTLICPRCKVDRYTQACPTPGLKCGLIGTTQGAPETATPSLPKCVLELLAVMNQDGGHYHGEHGTEAACKLATERYYEVLGVVLSLPAVLTDAQIEELASENGLYADHSFQGVGTAAVLCDFRNIVEFARDIERALATSATPVLP